MIDLKIAPDPTLVDQIAALANALAWPIVALIIALLFRKQIGGALKGVDEWSFLGNTLKFRKVMDQVEAGLDEAEAATPRVVTAIGTVKGSSTAIACDASIQPESALHGHSSSSPALQAHAVRLKAPQQAILDTWSTVACRVSGIAANHNLEGKDAEMWGVAKALGRAGIFTPQILGLARHLAKLRDNAAEGVGATSEDALRYAQLVDRFLELVAGL